jgi:hypothetical protein
MIIINEYVTQPGTIQNIKGKVRLENESGGRFLAEETIPDETVSAEQILLLTNTKTGLKVRLERSDGRPLDYYFSVV